MSNPQDGQARARHSCSICRQAFPADDLACFGERQVCIDCKPRFVQALREGVVLGEDDCWHHHYLIVLRRESQLPQRCLCCNAPAPPPNRHVRQVWISVLHAPTRIDVALPICERHRRRSRNVKLTAAAGILLGIAAMSLGFLWFGALLIAGSVIAISAVSLPISVHRVEQDYIWLLGAKKPFLDSLPPWPE